MDQLNRCQKTWSWKSVINYYSLIEAIRRKTTRRATVVGRKAAIAEAIFLTLNDTKLRYRSLLVVLNWYSANSDQDWSQFIGRWECLFSTFLPLFIMLTFWFIIPGSCITKNKTKPVLYCLICFLIDDSRLFLNFFHKN